MIEASACSYLLKLYYRSSETSILFIALQLLIHVVNQYEILVAVTHNEEVTIRHPLVRQDGMIIVLDHS